MEMQPQVRTKAKTFHQSSAPSEFTRIEFGSEFQRPSEDPHEFNFESPLIDFTAENSQPQQDLAAENARLKARMDQMVVMMAQLQAAPSSSKGPTPSSSKGPAPSSSKGPAPSSSKGPAPSSSKGPAASSSVPTGGYPPPSKLPTVPPKGSLPPAPDGNQLAVRREHRGIAQLAAESWLSDRTEPTSNRNEVHYHAPVNNYYVGGDFNTGVDINDLVKLLKRGSK
jgi:hypothetical protein